LYSTFVFMGKEKVSPLEIQKDQLTEDRVLVLYNDEVNTFDFVIDSLVEVCKHEPEQAEQCAWIAHFKGKCPVRSGGFDELKPLRTEMQDRGLTVSID
jgi:ATP-dependent Clp protease adaptor protein ClpS